MWRLMASVLVMSDTGSVSVTSEHTDWNSQYACEQTLQTIYVAPPPQDLGGHKVTMRISAQCVPVAPQFYR